MVCDARRIERIVRNLLDNGIEHGNEKGVLVELSGDPDVVSLTVRDFGVGLRPGEAGLVFNRFWRADPARARTTGGTGLGLAIALEDAHLHGGWLEAWGEPGMGACFRLTLPREAGGAVTHAVLPLSDEMSGNNDAADAADGANVGGSPQESAGHARGGVADDAPSADSLAFTVPIDGEGGPRR